MMGCEEDEAGEDLTGEVDLEASDSEDDLENLMNTEVANFEKQEEEEIVLPRKEEDETRTMRRECPVCQKILMASLVGLNHHVMGHFGRSFFLLCFYDTCSPSFSSLDNDEKKSKKRPVDAVGKGKADGKRGESSKKIKMVESSRAGFFSKRKP